MDVNRSSYYKWLKREDNPSQRMMQREKDITLIKKFTISILLMDIDG